MDWEVTRKPLWRGFNATCYTRKGFANSTFSHLNADASEITFKNFKGEVDLSPPDFFLHPPRARLREHSWTINLAYSFLKPLLYYCSSKLSFRFCKSKLSLWLYWYIWYLPLAFLKHLRKFVWKCFKINPFAKGVSTVSRWPSWKF